MQVSEVFLIFAHENYHIEQQMQHGRGWAGFYGQWFVDLLSHIGGNIYNIEGTLENEAELKTYNLFKFMEKIIE